MSKSIKLYQILEKANIETKIAVEIQDWILDTLDEKGEQAVIQVQENKILPMHQEMRQGFTSMRSEMDASFSSMRSEMDASFSSMRSEMDTNFRSIRSEMDMRFTAMHSEMDMRFSSMQSEMNMRFELVDRRFEMLQSEMNARFTSLEKRIDATNFSIRVLGVPIVGATIGGLGVIFLQIYQALK
ncbi:MAG: hypothetical protein O9264_11305 [Leptospira sp.]|nr:hypothetical protein [Leptospira sp.]